MATDLITRVNMGGRSMGNICRQMSQPRRLALWNQPIPEGMRLSWLCDVPYCGKREHMTLAENLSYGRFDWRPLMAQVSVLQEGESCDIITVPKDKVRLFATNLAVNYSPLGVHYLVRMLPKGGVRVIRYGDVNGDPAEWEAAFPVLARKAAAPPPPGLYPGAFWLGMLWNTSVHPKQIPAQTTCKAKGCVFPIHNNGLGLCYHHFHFFDYKASLTGRYVDDADIYGDDKEAPRFYVGWFYKHINERYKFEQGGKVSSWTMRVAAASSPKKDIEKWGAVMDTHGKAVCQKKQAYRSRQEAEDAVKRVKRSSRREATALHAYQCKECDKWHTGDVWSQALIQARQRVNMSASVPGLHGGKSGLHHGKKPPKLGRAVKASQKKQWASMIAHRDGNKRTPRKPEKRWNRDELEAMADQILVAAEQPLPRGLAKRNPSWRKFVDARSCPNMSFPDGPTAAHFAKEFAEKGRFSGTPYACDDCGAWHLDYNDDLLELETRYKDWIREKASDELAGEFSEADFK